MRNPLSAIGAVLSVATVIGGLGTWASIVSVFGTISLNGSSGDGKVVAGLGIIAAILAASHALDGPTWCGVTAAVLNAISALIGIDKWQSISSELGTETEFAVVTLGWGIQLLTISAVGAAIVLILGSLRVGQRSSAAGPSSAWSSTVASSDFSWLPSPQVSQGRTYTGRSVSVDPESASPGSEVLVTVTGYRSQDQVDIWWYDQKGRGHILTSRVPYGSTSHLARVRIPTWESPGYRRIQAKTSSDGRFAEISFLVTAAEPNKHPAAESSTSARSTVVPNSGPPGTELAVQSNEFAFDEEVSAYWIDEDGSAHRSAGRVPSTKLGFLARTKVPEWETAGKRVIELRSSSGKSISVVFNVTDRPADAGN